jgi:hypothetical protein
MNVLNLALDIYHDSKMRMCAKAGLIFTASVIAVKTDSLIFASLLLAGVSAVLAGRIALKHFTGNV